MNIIRFLIIVILYSIIPYCDVHKILVITHLPIKSHAILSHALVKLLLEAGHEVSTKRFEFVIECTNEYNSI